ncbi:MAG: hypothetical protein SGILL_007083 [Bacillariaceae sp.]
MAFSSILKTRAVLCIAFLALFGTATASIASFFLEDDTEVVSQRDPIRGTTGLALLPASPDCWLDAIQALKVQTGSVMEEAFYAASSEDGSHALNSLTCNWLSSVDQKVLALELSKCQLEDLQRPLYKFHEDKDQQACSKALQDYGTVQVGGSEKQHKAHQAKLSREVSLKCLSRLTENGFHVYTHFYSYVNQICTRLLSEFVLGRYYQTSHDLATTSKVAEEKIQKVIEHQEQLFKIWTEREAEVLGMYDNLETRVVKQTDGLESKIASLRSKLEEEQEHWKDEYQQFQKRLVAEFERHQKEFAIFARFIHKCQEALFSVQEALFSWTTPIESLWQSVQVGHSLFRGVFLYVGSLFCSLLVTWPRPFRWMRGFMVMLLMVGLMVEVGILFTTRPGTDHASLWREAYLQQCEVLRFWLFNILYAYFLLGVVRSILYGCRKVAGGEVAVHTIDANAPTIEHDKPEMQVFAPPTHRASAFHPPATFVYGSGRTPSKDDSAAATDASHDTGDQRSVAAPPFILENGMTSYGMQNPYVASPRAAQTRNFPGTIAPLAKTSENSPTGTSRAQASVATAFRRGTALPPSAAMTQQNTEHASEIPQTTLGSNHLQRSQAMETEDTNHEAVEGSFKKRPISHVTGEEQDRNAKRSRREGQDETSYGSENEEDAAEHDRMDEEYSSEEE